MNRKAIGNILIVVVLIAVMVGLNLLFYVDKREETESESRAERSTYSGRNYGLLGYYTLLEESNFPVARWRSPYTELEKTSDVRALFIITPSPGESPNKEELKALAQWVWTGGTVIVIDRDIQVQFGDQLISTIALPPPALFKDHSLELAKNEPGKVFPWQPVAYFQGVDRIAISEFASALTWVKRPIQKETPKPLFPPPPKPRPPTEERKAPPTDDDDAEAPDEEIPNQDDFKKLGEHEEGVLTTFVPYAGMDKSTIFGSLHYGAGEVLFLTDPYVFANNGLTQADNAALGLNLAEVVLNRKHSKGGVKGRLLFDEYHHGYREGMPTYTTVTGYFRGTVVPWVFWQLVLVTLLVLYTYGRRFARPLPLKRLNRASTLEFVSAMAQIQSVAESYDLAIENLYGRFHRGLCRYGGVPTTMPLERLAAAVGRRAKRNPEEIHVLLRRCQDILNGKSTSEKEMLQLAKQMRDLEHKLGLI